MTRRAAQGKKLFLLAAALLAAAAALLAPASAQAFRYLPQALEPTSPPAENVPGSYIRCFAAPTPRGIAVRAAVPRPVTGSARITESTNPAPVQGYDRCGRIAYRADGDEGVWWGKHDAWDRLYEEHLPTGAVVQRWFDRAHSVTREVVHSGDPDSVPPPELLSDLAVEVTSYGAPKRMVGISSSDPLEALVTEWHYDPSGRLHQVRSGPLDPATSELDLSRARRDAEYQYETQTGRVLAQWQGGHPDGPPEVALSYTYGPEGQDPWPDSVTALEAVPGLAILQPTETTAYSLRDSLGRVVEERHSDGSTLLTEWDRSGGAIRLTSGAQAQTAVGRDSRGQPLLEVRASGGQTLRAFDLDGSLVRERVGPADGGWQRRWVYDDAGRLSDSYHPDGSSESYTYHPDGEVHTWTTRDRVTVTYTYDPANLLQTAVPSAAGPLEGSLEPLDGGDAFTWDPLSRPLAATRLGPSPAPWASDPALLAVTHSGYDLAGRVRDERVGTRPPTAWSYDPWGNPEVVTPPAGVAGFELLSRTFDTLDRLTSVAGGQGQPALGADWVWGGGRLYALTTRGPLGVTHRYGYYGQPGLVLPQGHDPGSTWRLASLTVGAAGTTPATEPPAVAWGRLGLGYRGASASGGLGDGYTVGRAVLDEGLGLLGDMGWSWVPDGGLRLAYAERGRGALEELPAGAPEGATSTSLGFGASDQLELILDHARNELVDLEPGIAGRVSARNGVPFGYDLSGRRTFDDRLEYRWDWRGQLAVVTVKEGWGSPYAGHQLRYSYDATGRLHRRLHLARLPDGATDDSERPFVELRDYLWEGGELLAETGYGSFDGGLGQLFPRWRRSYLPGASGLDDQVQVRAEVYEPAGSPYPDTLYAILRDELGSVVGLVEERPGADPTAPPLVVRYLYAPFGGAYAETGPELRRATFDNELTSVEVGGNVVAQTIADPAVSAAGGLRLALSLGLDEGSLPTGVTLDGPLGALSQGADYALAWSNAGDEVVVLPLAGWQRGQVYYLTLSEAITDRAGRTAPRSVTVEVAIPGDQVPVVVDEVFEPSFDSSVAAADTLGGRFPGGQSLLFQGLWHDPVTGLGYARARWLDTRHGVFLSEDPVGPVDSPNLYAFVAWQPHQLVDPLGEESMRQYLDWQRDREEGRFLLGGVKEALYDLWNLATLGFVARHDESLEQYEAGGDLDKYVTDTVVNVAQSAVEAVITYGTGGTAAVTRTSLRRAVLAGMKSGALAGGAVTVVGDVADRLRGGEGYSVEDYAAGVGGGALFGGASARFVFKGQALRDQLTRQKGVYIQTRGRFLEEVFRAKKTRQGAQVFRTQVGGGPNPPGIDLGTLEGGLTWLNEIKSDIRPVGARKVTSLGLGWRGNATLTRNLREARAGAIEAGLRTAARDIRTGSFGVRVIGGPKTVFAEEQIRARLSELGIHNVVFERVSRWDVFRHLVLSGR